MTIKFGLDGSSTEALIQEVELLKNEEVEGVWEAIHIFEPALRVVLDVEFLVRCA